MVLIAATSSRGDSGWVELGPDPRTPRAGSARIPNHARVAMAETLEQTCVWGMCVGGITRETYNMRGFRIRTCSQGGVAPWPSPWAAPPSMPVENPAAVNSSVRPRSRKRACYGLSRLRTGECRSSPPGSSPLTESQPAVSRARHGPAPCLPSMPRPPSPARGAHLPTVRLGRLQPAGSHLQDLQGATDGRPAAVLFDRLRHARWQPAQGPGRSHSSRPPPLRPVRHPRRRHLLPAPSIRRAVPAARLAGPAARGWRLPQVRRALGHENVLRAPSPAAQRRALGLASSTS